MRMHDILGRVRMSFSYAATTFSYENAILIRMNDILIHFHTSAHSHKSHPFSLNQCTRMSRNADVVAAYESDILIHSHTSAHSYKSHTFSLSHCTKLSRSANVVAVDILISQLYTPFVWYIE